MAYIGNQVVSSSFTVDVFSGTGSQTAFVGLTFAPASTAAIAVYVAGVYQSPTSYSLSGTTLNFNSAPAAGTSNIQVLHLGTGATAGVPSDGSVTTAKMSANAIVTSSIADANVTDAKIVTVANTKITGLVTASQIANVANTQITGVLTASQLANTAVTAGVYGGSNNSTLITVDAQGRITSASNVSTSNSQFTSVGVGTAPSGTTGEIRATNNITAYYSDERLKNKLGNIENALVKLESLNGFYYEANETAQSLGYDVIREVGVSAQEVQYVLPEVVVPAPIDEKYLTVRYERLVPLLIEAIKELSEKVKDLENK